MNPSPATETPGVTREFVGLDSTTARRAGTGGHPSDAQRIYDALAGADKTLLSVDTDHYFTTPGARSETADTIARWIARRW